MTIKTNRKYKGKFHSLLVEVVLIDRVLKVVQYVWDGGSVRHNMPIADFEKTFKEM